MKKIVSLVLGLFMLLAWSACKKGSGLEVQKTVDGYNVTVNLAKNPSIIGQNPITVKVADSAGKAVTEAMVMVEYSMPEMPGMPAMNYEVHAALAGEIYSAVMNLSMAGPWNIAVKITKGDKVSTVRLSIDVR